MKKHTLFACLLALVALPSYADQLQIAVAANFLGTLQKLAPQFEASSGHTLVLSGGASGQFYNQISHGAPFDVFLSADTERPQKLEADGLTVTGTRFTYAIGKLVLWSATPALIDSEGQVLKSDKYKFVALADPKLAPYGAAAQQVLEHLGLWDSLNASKKVVVGESIGQALQFTSSGNAEIGFVAWAQVVGDSGKPAGSWWLPAQSLYNPITQDGVVLQSTQHRAAADAFMHWLRTDAKVRAAIEAAGYSLPAGA